MRYLIGLIWVLGIAAGPAVAGQIVVGSHITAVTVYAQGAQVTREVDFTAPAGASEVLITDLPSDTQAGLIRLQADGVVLGAFSLRTDRLPPRDYSTDPDVLAAKAAASGLPAAQKAVADAQKLLADAQASQAALSQGAVDYTGLSVAVTADVAGPAKLVVSHFVPDASWQPVYDMMLTRKDPKLTIARGALVSQYSGEDWVGVDLTLSTAQPSAQAEPSSVWPELRRLVDLVPYSEQEELAISFTADPAPTEVDVDGQRGVLAWQFDLAPGEKKAVQLEHVISWPEGKELQ